MKLIDAIDNFTLAYKSKDKEKIKKARKDLDTELTNAKFSESDIISYILNFEMEVDCILKNGHGLFGLLNTNTFRMIRPISKIEEKEWQKIWKLLDKKSKEKGLDSSGGILYQSVCDYSQLPN